MNKKTYISPKLEVLFLENEYSIATGSGAVDVGKVETPYTPLLKGEIIGDDVFSGDASKGTVYQEI